MNTILYHEIRSKFNLILYSVYLMHRITKIVDTTIAAKRIEPMTVPGRLFPGPPLTKEVVTPVELGSADGEILSLLISGVLIDGVVVEVGSVSAG